MTEPAGKLSSSRLPPLLNLEKLFARGNYRPAMGLSPLHVSEYFKNGGWPEILAERQRLLASTPEDFVCECASEPDRRIVGNFARRWNPDLEVGSFVKLGREWEPDFIVVNRHPPPLCWEDASVSLRAGACPKSLLNRLASFMPVCRHLTNCWVRASANSWSGWRSISFISAQTGA